MNRDYPYSGKWDEFKWLQILGISKSAKNRNARFVFAFQMEMAGDKAAKITVDDIEKGLIYALQSQIGLAKSSKEW